MSVGLKYLALVGSTLLVFANFVACGAQMYQVSMRGDHDSTRSHPDAHDPKSNRYGLHASHGWIRLPIRFKVGSKMEDKQINGLRQAMQSWESAVGRKLFDFGGVHVNVEGDSFPDLFSSLSDGTNGNYLDHDWLKTQKADVILATTIWQNAPGDDETIETADIRYNLQHYVLGDALEMRKSDTREVVDMESLALHELGHLLGLTHIEADVDGQSIMNPTLYVGEGLINRRLSAGDVERVQKIYGCQGKACDIESTVRKISRIKSGDDSDSGLDELDKETDETTRTN
jgi:hypothetical protein